MAPHSNPRCVELCKLQSVCIHVYLELGEPLCDAADCAVKLYVHHAVLKCENCTDINVNGTCHAD